MFCMKCGASLPDDANFCFKCGCDLRNLSQSPGMDFSAVKVGDYVKFGRYPQNNGDVKEPIEWLVLEVNSNEAVILSRYGLDFQPYNRDYTDTTWEDCYLRKWLNNDFLNAAFSTEDQLRIKLSKVVNTNHRQYGTHGGNDTQDKVFCLSLAEAEHYFKKDSERRCRFTVHAPNRETWAKYDRSGHCFWWLRSPGYAQNYTSIVRPDGEIYPGGRGVIDDTIAVRPSLRLILNL